MSEPELSCGEELAASAEVPAAVAALFAHVALNLETHASWVGFASEAARREHEALLEVSQGYRDLAQCALEVAQRMRSFRSLPRAEHDPAGLDRAGFVTWMRTKVSLQRELARLLTEHAERNERAMAELAGSGLPVNRDG